jgi:hypothetical protein
VQGKEFEELQELQEFNRRKGARIQEPGYQGPRVTTEEKQLRAE